MLPALHVMAQKLMETPDNQSGTNDRTYGGKKTPWSADPGFGPRHRVSHFGHANRGLAQSG